MKTSYENQSTPENECVFRICFSIIFPIAFVCFSAASLIAFVCYSEAVPKEE